MASKLLLIKLCLLLLLAVPSWAQVRPDTSAVSAVVPPGPVARPGATEPAVPFSDEDEFNPGLGLILLFAIGITLVAVGAGAALALLAVALAAGLLAAGLVSGAALVGLWQRSWSAGLRVLLWGLALLGGAVAGAVLTAVIHYVAAVTNTRDALLLGSGLGLLTGVLAAYVCQRLLRWAVAAARRRWSHRPLAAE